MQTLTVNVQDDFIQDFLSIIGHYNEKVQVQKDENLEYDPYFYERKKQLQEVINDIDRGEIKMLSQEQYDKEINNFFTELKSKYAN